jgi:hypothetical protein
MGTTAMRIPKNKSRNLEVLPQDISDQMLIAPFAMLPIKVFQTGRIMNRMIIQ